MERELNPVTWYAERELSFTPKHFTISKTPVTIESKLWILHNLQGRYSILSRSSGFSQSLILTLEDVPAFEDPKEAMMYELTWS